MKIANKKYTRKYINSNLYVCANSPLFHTQSYMRFVVLQGTILTGRHLLNLPVVHLIHLHQVSIQPVQLILGCTELVQDTVIHLILVLQTTQHRILIQVS